MPIRVRLDRILLDRRMSLTELADRAHELSEQMHGEAVRTALLQSEMVRLRDEREQSQRDADANRRQIDAILNTKTFRMLGPVRRLYGRFRPRPPPGS